MLDVTTDGSITPEDAFYSSSNILLEHFDFLKNYKELPKTEIKEEVPAEESKEKLDESEKDESKEEKKTKKKKSE